MTTDDNVICQYRYAAPCSALVCTLACCAVGGTFFACLAVFATGGIRIGGPGPGGVELSQSETRMACAVLALVAAGTGCAAAWKISERFASDSRIAVTETHLILPGQAPDFEGRMPEQRIAIATIRGLSVRSDKQTREKVAFTFEIDGQPVVVRRTHLPTQDAFDEVLHLLQRGVTWGNRELPDYVAEEQQHAVKLQEPAYLVLGVPAQSIDLRLVKIKEFAERPAAEEFAGFLREGGAFRQIEVRQRRAAGSSETDPRQFLDGDRPFDSATSSDTARADRE